MTLLGDDRDILSRNLPGGGEAVHVDETLLRAARQRQTIPAPPRCIPSVRTPRWAPA